MFVIFFFLSFLEFDEIAKRAEEEQKEDLGQGDEKKKREKKKKMIKVFFFFGMKLFPKDLLQFELFWSVVK